MADYLLTGLWQTGEGNRYVWYATGLASFQAKADSLSASGFVLQSLDIADQGGTFLWSGSWVAGNATQVLAADLSWSDFQSCNQQMSSRGMQVFNLRSYDGPGRRNWAALWRTGDSDSVIVGPLPWEQFWPAWLEQDRVGYRMIDFDTYVSAGQRFWSGVWRLGSGDQYIWVNSNWTAFTATNDDLRSRGYRLKTLCSYSDNANRRWAGTWRKEPGEFAVVTDLNEQQFWAEWDRQARRGLLLAGVHAWTGTGYAPPSVAQGRVRLHIKVLSEPTVAIPRMLDRMREVYEPIGLQVEVSSVETLERTELLDLDAGSCSQSVTAAQQQLFASRNNVGERDIVVYFVRSTLPPYNGCAAFPPGRPGAVIASYATEWTLAHEVGHVLGLFHVADNRRLMTGLGTANIVDLPPDVTPQEVSTMLSSSFLARI